jgi:thioredoxin 1
MSIQFDNKVLSVLIFLFLLICFETKAQQNIDINKKVYTKKSIDSLIHSNKNVLLFFTATWCGTCKKMEPVLEELNSDLGKRVKIIKVDYDINRTLASSMYVYEIPFIQIFIDGDLKENIIGMMEERMLKEMIVKK